MKQYRFQLYPDQRWSKPVNSMEMDDVYLKVRRIMKALKIPNRGYGFQLIG